MNPRRTNRLRKEQQRGSALLLALFFLVLLYLIAVALFRLIPGELHSVGRTRQDMQAHYAAAAGVKLGALQSMTESGDYNYNPIVTAKYASAAAGDEAAPTQVDTGVVTISATVDVVYALEG